MQVRGIGVAATVVAVALTGCQATAVGEVAPTFDASDPSTSAATPAPTNTPTPLPRTFTVASTGDPLLHQSWWYQAQDDALVTGNGDMDFGPGIASTAAITQAADLAICHFETVLAPLGGPYSGYPMFSSPPQIVPALKAAGYDVCATASNHTLDQGAEAIDRTLGFLDEAGIAHTGSASTPEAANTPLITAVPTPQGPVAVANLSYTFSFNGIPYPNGETWRANAIDVPAILDEAARAKAAGAEVVILNMHWGTEYSQTANEEQIAQAQALTASPNIDIILGGHAHVVQPIAVVNGKWVTYGHGNLFACHREPGTPREEGLLTRFTFTETAEGRFTVTDAEYVPLLTTCGPTRPHRVMNIPVALATGDYGVYGQDRLEVALARTTEVVNSLGAGDQGLRPLSQ